MSSSVPKSAAMFGLRSRPRLFSSAIRIRPIIKDYTVSGSKSRQVSVLLVEDEALIRMMIGDMVEELGHTVVAEAGNMTEALALARTADFEIAVLDINVAGERIEPVADIIAGRDLPFIFASGYGAAGAPEKFRDRPTLQKPFLIERLGKAIDETLERNQRRDQAAGASK
jgi:DNA-binding NtrC family response regulator